MPDLRRGRVRPPPQPPPGAAGAGSTASVRHPPARIVSGFEDDPVELTDPRPYDATLDTTGPAGEPEAEIEWMDDQPGAAAVATGPGPEEFAQEEIDAQARTARKPARTRPSGDAEPVVRRPSRKTAARLSPVEPPEPTVPVVSLAERLRRSRNIVLFVAVPILVVGTIAFRTWRARRAELPMIAELGRVEGLPALDAGKFDRAHQILSEAKRAVIALGDAVEGAAEIRQGADEAAIIAGLVPGGLEALLDEAARADAKTWPNTFNSLYKGRSVIVDAHIKAVPRGEGKGAYELDYRIFREGGEGEAPQSIGRIDTTDFHLFALTTPKVGDRVTFGARLASFRFDLSNEEWLIGLEPESGVSMTHFKALEALGWPAEDEASGEEKP